MNVKKTLEIWLHPIAIATDSGRNQQFVRDLRADEFVNYTAQPFEEVVKNIDTNPLHKCDVVEAN
jgi:NADPH:quinone reductase-like Zn-dependent oxidoreductase